MSEPFMTEMCRLEQCIDRKDWTYQHSAEELAEIKQAWRQNYKWEFSSYVTDEDVKKGNYKIKNVFVIDAKPKGAVAWDRIGSISY